jgi:hypothetical protein
MTRKRVLVKAERIARYLLRRPVLLVTIGLLISFLIVLAIPETRERIGYLWASHVWWPAYALIFPYPYFGR